jgi:hypothetical protein
MTTITLELIGDTVVQTNVISNPVTQVEVIHAPVISIEMSTGARGPQGVSGGEQIKIAEAGENLSSGRGVWIDSDNKAYYFQPSDVSQVGLIYGITLTAATIGTNVDIRSIGEITDAAFPFGIGKMLWFTDDGEIVDVAPINSAAVLQKAGVSVGPNRIKIDFSIQIILQ